jgi:hypothetical protein
MVGSRTLTAIVGLLASMAISAAAWYYFDTFLLFLLVPFVPLLLRRREATSGGHDAVRECSTCGFRTAAQGYEYCPRDGTRLT